MLDCISQATGASDKFQGLPLGARAVQIADGTHQQLLPDDVWPRPRDTVCACEAKTEPTLSQALHMLNGNTIQGKVQQGGVVKKLLDAEQRRRGHRVALHPRLGPQAHARRDRPPAGRRRASPPIRSKAWKTSSGPS